MNWKKGRQHRRPDLIGSHSDFYDTKWGLVTTRKSQSDLTPVTLVESGTGANGTSESRSTFRYDAYRLDGTEYGLDLPVEMSRPIGRMEIGKIGLACLNAAGDKVLWWVDEVPVISVCEAVGTGGTGGSGTGGTGGTGAGGAGGSDPIGGA